MGFLYTETAIPSPLGLENVSKKGCPLLIWLLNGEFYMWIDGVILEHCVPVTLGDDAEYIIYIPFPVFDWDGELNMRSSKYSM